LYYLRTGWKHLHKIW